VKKFAKYLAVSGMVVSLFLINSLAFMMLFGAFVSTYFGVPKLSMAESAGLLFLIRFVFPLRSDTDKSSIEEIFDKYMENIVVKFLYPVLTVAIAYFIYQLV
jgi:ABC-type transport system involved in multi-copper enzyme maturation permease subunit